MSLNKLGSFIEKDCNRILIQFNSLGRPFFATDRVTIIRTGEISQDYSRAVSCLRKSVFARYCNPVVLEATSIKDSEVNGIELTIAHSGKIE